MKLINGTEVIDNLPNEKAGELAEAIFDDVVFLLDLEEKCIAENEDGTYNTELGQDLFNCIYEQCMNYFEREMNQQEDFTTTEPQGKVYDPPMTDTEQYLLNKEREEEHKSYDY